MTEKLYWADAERKVIEVSELNGSSRGLVIWEKLVAPGSLALSPLDALLVWSDVGSNVIETATMDGSQRQVIVRGVRDPRGLTIAKWKNKRTLFWIDRAENSIACSLLDGSEKRVLLGGPGDVLSRPYALEVLNGRIYWSDSGDNVIKTVDLKDVGSDKGRGGKGPRLIETLDFILVNGVVVGSLVGFSKNANDRQQPAKNPCKGMHFSQYCNKICFTPVKSLGYLQWSYSHILPHAYKNLF